MSSASLLNLNVDTLFEQHSVAEIDIVQKKIQSEVEKKREELRTMVGERYRDLLKAADTIATMRDSSQLLIKQIDCITVNCKSLNEQQLIGFKTGDTADVIKNRSANKQLNNYFSTMIQIKLLTSLPEMIWSHVDNNRFFVATELFMFSRHISTGLQLDVNNKLMKFLPVAKKQWEILKPFHITIKQKALVLLEEERLSAEMATDCLMALFLLEKNSLNGVLKTFLQLRSAAYLRSLSDNQDDEQKRVKDRILGSLMVLNSTMDLVWKCFLDSGDGEGVGLITQKLKDRVEVNPLPTLALMDTNEVQFSYMLPEIIASFSPKVELQTFDEQQGRNVIEQFVADISRIADIHLKNLFEFVPSLNAIQEIKKESLTLQTHSSLTSVCEKLHLSQIADFHESLYVPLIIERIRHIIQQSWLETVNKIINSVDYILKSNALRDAVESSNLWIENEEDLPSNLNEALSQDKKMKKLSMKMRGYNTVITTTCTAFDQKLQGIVDQMNALLEEQSIRSEEKLSLVQFLREISEEQMSVFVSRIKELNLHNDRDQLLFIVHFLPAILELCPNLKICLTQSSKWRQLSLNSINGISCSTACWDRICSLIEKETSALWTKVIEILLQENSIENFMPIEIGFETILHEFANWETVTLEQKDEAGNPIQSSFRIPVQPRISLQEYLFVVIHTLNNAVPETLPQNILTMFNKELLSKLIQYYKLQVEHQFISTSQNIALQLYFDLKFLQLIFSSRDDRLTIDDIQQICRKLKDFIDPFDFELFSEHISNNVKRSAIKMNCQLGVICANSQSAVSAGSVNTQQDKEPNLLNLSSNGSTTIWFPLLPIITPGSYADDSERESNPAAGAEAEKASSISQLPSRRNDATKQTTQNVTSNVKSGAAAFFGAMSQDWFR